MLRNVKRLLQGNCLGFANNRCKMLLKAIRQLLGIAEGVWESR
jgi:hypothetical protein